MTNESDTYGLPDHDIYFLSQWLVFLFFYYNQPNIFGFEDFSDKSHKLKTSALGLWEDIRDICDRFLMSKYLISHSRKDLI